MCVVSSALLCFALLCSALLCDDDDDGDRVYATAVHGQLVNSTDTESGFYTAKFRTLHTLYALGLRHVLGPRIYYKLTVQSRPVLTKTVPPEPS